MKTLQKICFALLLLSQVLVQAQDAPSDIRIKGKVIDKLYKQPLEYATVTLKNTSNPKQIAGGMTDSNGNFDIVLKSGTYDIKVEFISFKSKEMKAQKLTKSTDIGTIVLDDDVSQLNEVVVRAQKTTVEIKLDKKVYNVGQDLMVKGGTVSDVLDNIPSVSVDIDGNVSLRGNQNVRILVDGRPSNAINISEALRQIPADAIEKVEVITNPSARYDAEGGGGILNIVLKKGKNLGVNGTLILSAGYPENYNASASVNYKMKGVNIFSNLGYINRNNQSRGINQNQNLNADGSVRNYSYENSKTENIADIYNGNFGIELTLAPNTFWTNGVNFRNNKGNNSSNVFYQNFDQNKVFTNHSNRLNDGITSGNNLEYTSNFLKNFNDKGHKLSADFSYSKNTDDSNSIISQLFNDVLGPNKDKTLNNQVQYKTTAQVDYVLPFANGTQLEAGYKGDFTNLNNQYQISKSTDGLDFIIDNNLSNTLEYKEKINALYTQYGFKKNKFSYLFGFRWEGSNIEVNQLETKVYKPKKYDNFFPSAFITYEFEDQASVSASFSKRISRPRGRFMNPFVNYASNINIFQGNPDLDPSISNKIDFGFMKKFGKISFNSSLYYEHTTDVFTFVKMETGEMVNNVPVMLSTPINLAKEANIGFEFTINYSPIKWWRLNTNFNLYNVKTTGEYKYTNFKGVEVVQNFDNQAFTWFARLGSRITLPYKIEWQTNMNYMGAQKTAQGKTYGMFGANLAFSKDILKEKATIALNISDVFNSRFRRTDFNTQNVNSYGEMQYRPRTIMASFTYRFNKKKNEKEKMPRPQSEGDAEY